MAKTVTIALSEPIEGHKGTISCLVFREPRWQDVMGTGSPYTVHRDAEGKAFLVYDEAAIAHYAEACMVEPNDSVLVSASVGLADTLKARDAIVGFFLDASAGAAG